MPALGAPGPHNVGVVDAFIESVQASGRLTFSLHDVAGAVPTSGRALEAALRRRAATGAIARVSSRAGFFVVVPPEHRAMGCPPVEWWLDDLMAHLGAPYYVGLHSAAAAHGSSHFAVMETQVVTSAWMRPLRVGRTRIRFVQRRNVEAMPVEVRQGQWGPLRVATPETVAVDLVREGACGADRVALTLAEMPARLGARRLARALDGAGDVPAAQRLGYVLEWLGRAREAGLVGKWLAGRPLRTVSLGSVRGREAEPCSPGPWRVRGGIPEGILA